MSTGHTFVSVGVPYWNNLWLNETLDTGEHYPTPSGAVGSSAPLASTVLSEHRRSHACLKVASASLNLRTKISLPLKKI